MLIPKQKAMPKDIRKSNDTGTSIQGRRSVVIIDSAVNK
jgi:hypothetical protein